jgi:Leucine-rich repeat (LRR) protein
VSLTLQCGGKKIVPASAVFAENAMCRDGFGSRKYLLVWPVLLLWSGLACAFIPQSEHDTLVAIYNATGGSNWTNHTGWNGKPRTECGWYGVTCDAADTHVIKLSLDSNNLTGALPALSGLPSLGTVYLSVNSLTALPPDLASLSALTYFYADQNQITGTLPDLSGLQNLAVFSMGGNQLGGVLPSLPSGLQEFFVNLNQFTGSIPSSLEFASGLQIYNVQFNRLTGPVPNVLGGLAALRHFLVAGNRLSGTLPDVPIINNLQNTGSALCPNLFVPLNDSAWDAATGQSPWWTDCPIFLDGFDF